MQGSGRNQWGIIGIKERMVWISADKIFQREAHNSQPIWFYNKIFEGVLKENNLLGKLLNIRDRMVASGEKGDIGNAKKKICILAGW